MKRFYNHFKEQWPEYKKFYAHASTCPKCQQALLEFKGPLEIKFITTSDAEFIEELRRLSV